MQAGLVYIPAIEMPGYYNDKGIDFKHWQPARGMVLNLGINFGPVDDVPKNAGSSLLLAWNPITQKPAWRIPMKAIWNGGTATTAGNLVFEGHADGRFVAYSADTGAPLWTFDAQTGIVGAPITYKVAGRQYVFVLAGYGGAGAALGSLSAQPNYPSHRFDARIVRCVNFYADEPLGYDTALVAQCMVCGDVFPRPSSGQRRLANGVGNSTRLISGAFRGRGRTGGSVSASGGTFELGEAGRWRALALRLPRSRVQRIRTLRSQSAWQGDHSTGHGRARISDPRALRTGLDLDR
jgi:PQQ-like domain